MPKVIHKSKKCEAISSASQQNLNLELHRGLEGNTSDPYLYRSNPKEKARKLLWTLVSVISHPRCSSTFIRNQRNLRLIGAVSSIALILIISLTLVPVSTKTDTADATTGTATESSTTITVNQATATVDLTAAAADGTFATSEGAGIASFGVRTTNYTGYTLTVKASDNDGTLNNTSGTGSFTSISSVLDEKTFDTSAYNGKWGYKPSKYNSIENVAYWPSPTTTATTLDVTKVANSTDNTYTIALGARAAYTQPTGVYSKTVILTATSNPAAYSITYTDNTGTNGTKGADVTNLPDTTTSDTTATTINLSSVTPSRPGYVFDGWCSVAPTASGTSCSGTKYNAGGSYGIDQTTTNVVILYATWKVPSYTIVIKTSTGISNVTLNSTNCSSTSGCNVTNLTYGQEYTLTATTATGYTFDSWYVDGMGNVGTGGAAAVSDITSASTKFKIGEGSATITAVARYTMPANVTMQTFTTQMCAAMPQEQTYTLTDARDNTMYAVAKLKDGKCWMLQNLKLGSKSDNIALTTADSAVPAAGFTLSSNEAGAEGKFPYVTRTDDATAGTTVYVKDKSEYYCTNDYGCYYNWYTATAGTGKGEGSAATGDGVTVSSSICPKGWNLPTGGSGGQFQVLANAYGGTNAAVAAALLVDNPTTAKENINGSKAPGLLLSGRYGSGGANDLGAYGYYWSRTSVSIGSGYDLYINTSGVGPLDHGSKYRGFAVRCVAN